MKNIIFSLVLLIISLSTAWSQEKKSFYFGADFSLEPIELSTNFLINHKSHWVSTGPNFSLTSAGISPSNFIWNVNYRYILGNKKKLNYFLGTKILFSNYEAYPLESPNKIIPKDESYQAFQENKGYSYLSFFITNGIFYRFKPGLNFFMSLGMGTYTRISKYEDHYSSSYSNSIAFSFQIGVSFLINWDNQ